MRRDQKKRFARAAIVVAVLALAVGLTLVFAMAGGSSRASKGHVFASKLAAQEVMGNRGEAERLPDGGDINAAAAEDYAAQAYPAAGIPLQATINAQQAWAGAKSRGLGRGHNRPGDWTLAGPSKANFPGVLTFSSADYTTSGRVTALAIDPSCCHGNCRVWAAAAGGCWGQRSAGIWSNRSPRRTPRTGRAPAGRGPGRP